MKQKMLSPAIGLFCMLMLGPGAQAQTTAFDVFGPTPADGDWHVVIVETGDAFTIQVHAGGTTPSSKANEVQVTFEDQSHNAMAATNNGGGLVGVAPWNNVPNGDTMTWHLSNPPGVALDNNGGNTFLGNATVSPLPGEYEKYVDVTVIDSAHGPWTEEGDALAPEASSLALLLPGLIPLGIALRRRRKTRD